jgi:serine protease inhibitor
MQLIGGNGVVSPVSIYYALYAAYLGSNCTTLTELQKVLGLSETSRDVHAIANHEGQDYILSNNNMIVYHSKAKIIDTYRKRYAAAIGGELVPFSSPSGAVQVVNQMVNKTTRGMIPQILSGGDVDDSTMAIILNTIYFKSKWAIPFSINSTRTGTFYGMKQSTQVPLMHISDKKFLYAEDHDNQMIQLPYVNKSLAMYIVLPKTKTDPGKMCSSLIFRNYSEQSVNLTLPKFEHRQRTHLIPVLQKMGIKQLFTPYEADLSKMTGSKNVFVSDVIHEAVVKVDESGTEAAAVTAMTLSYNCMPTKAQSINFNANHTFYYAIVDKSQQLILFNGIFL